MYNTTKTSKILAAGLMTLLFLPPSMANECGHVASSDATASYEFNDIDLSDVIQLANLKTGKKVIGMELLAGKRVSAAAEKVNITAFVDAILLVNGFHFEEDQENWIITKM